MKLSAKIGLIISVSIISSLVISAYIVARSVRNTTLDTITLDQRETAVQTLDKIDRYLYERSIDAQMVSSNSQFAQSIQQQSAANSTAATSLLNSIKTFNGSWDNLTLFDRSSKIIATTSKATSEKFFEETNAKNLYKEALTGRVVHSDLYIDNITNQPTILFMSPIRPASQAQRTIGVIAGKISWPAVIEILYTVDDALATLHTKDGLEIAANHEPQGVLINDISESELFKRFASSPDTTGTVGVFPDSHTQEEYNFSFAKQAGYLDYEGNGWYLSLAVPNKDILSPSQGVTTRMIAALIITMTSSLIFVLLVMRQQVIKPVKQLSKAVEKIAAGDWSHKVPVTSNDELGQLAGSFNAMESQLALAAEQIEHEKTRLEASINSLPLGFILTDIDNSIITLNPRMHSILGIKHSVKTLDKSIELLEVILEKCQSAMNKKKNITFSETTKSGRYLHMFVSPIIEEDKVIGAVALIEDVTEAKILERSKEEFFSIASHELRTPLTAIRGNATLVRQFFGDKVKDPEFGQMMDDIQNSSIGLIEIVNDFLDASRLEQGKMEFKNEAFDISKIIESVAYEMHAVMKERKLYLKTDKTLSTLPKAYGDVNRVKQIIYNLTGNALKFTDKGGITIKAHEEGKSIRIIVEDSGRGIPDDKQALLFRKFQQAGSSLFTRDTTRGTGLGLYISKLLIEHMGGKLFLDWSKEGKGSSFSFTVPIAEEKRLPS